MEIALGTPEWYFEVMYVEWKLVLVRFEIVFVLAKDRCTVCAKCTSGMEIILGVADGTLGDLGQVEAHFSPFGDSPNLNAR